MSYSVGSFGATAGRAISVMVEGYMSLLLLMLGMVVQDPAQNVGWQLGRDGRLELIVHVRPEHAQQLQTLDADGNPPELAVPLPEIARGKYDRLIVRISNDPPERELSEAELAVLPVRQPNITRTTPNPGFASIDPTPGNLRERDVSLASGDSQDFQNPPSLGSPAATNTLRDRDRDGGVPVTDPRSSLVPLNPPSNSGLGSETNAPNAGSFNSPSFGNGGGSSLSGSGFSSNATAGNTTFPSLQPPVTSNLLNTPGQYTPAPNSPSTMTSLNRQPTFGSSSSMGTNGLGGQPTGGMFPQDSHPFQPTNGIGSSIDPTLLARRDQPSDLNMSGRQFTAGATGLPNDPTNTSGWYFPLFFLVSFVVNIYFMIYLVKLRERYRALLAGARAGMELGSTVV